MMNPAKKSFFVLMLGAFACGHLGRYLLPGSILGRVNPLDLLVIGVVLWGIYRRVPLVNNRWLRAFSLMLVLSFFVGLSLFGPYGQIEALFYTVRLAAYLAFIALTPAILKNEGWWWVLWVGILISLIGFVQLKLFPAIPVSFIAQYGFDPHNGRLFGTFFDPNFVASMLLVTTTVTLGLWLREKNWWIIVAGGLQLAALLATQSRSGLVGFVVAVAVVLAALRPRWLLLGAATGMVLLFFSSSLMARLMGGLAVDATSQARFASWQTAEMVIKPVPITGVGYNFYQSATVAVGRFTPRIGQIALAANASDSSLLTIWSTVGIFGLVAALGWLLVFSSPSADVVGGVVARGMIAGLLVNSLFINSLLYPFVLFLLALTVASIGAKTVQHRG